MKQIHDFVYCDAVLTSQTVFYLVKAGSSVEDRQALRFVGKVARSPNFYFTLHNNASMAFIERCAASIFTVVDNITAMKLLRRQVVDIKWLASFLRKFPPCLLNSSGINPVENKVYFRQPNP